MGTFKGKLNGAKNKVCIQFLCPLNQFEELKRIQERRKRNFPDRLKDSLADTIRYLLALGIAEEKRRIQLFKDETDDSLDNGEESHSDTFKKGIPIIEGIRLMEHD